MKRLIVTFLAAVALLAAPTSPARAEYPEKPVTIVFPNKAGSGYHKIILGILSVLEGKIPRPVGVQAMPGAGTAAGARFVQSQAADGHTLLFIHEATIQASILGMLGFEMNEEFEALARVNTSSGGQYVRPDSPFSSLSELQAHAKENPGEVRASINTGALSHIDILNISEELGIELRLVHVSGGDSGSRQALLSGDVDIIKVNPVSMNAMVKDGMVKPIAYYGTERHEFLPDIPTMEEQGFTLPSTSNVHGYLWIRRSAPDEAKEFWRSVLKEALTDPENEAKLEGLLGVDIEYLGGADLEAAVQEQFETRARLIEEHGIKRK